MKITVVFTEAEARELELCAGNGYGDGDFYQGGMGRGTHSKEMAFLRAVRKLNIARHSALDRRSAGRKGT